MFPQFDLARARLVLALCLTGLTACGPPAATVPVADLHCDHLYQLSMKPDRTVADLELNMNIEWLEEGGYAVQVFAIFSQLTDKRANVAAREQLAAFHHRVLAPARGRLRQARSLEDVLKNRESGAISAILAFEGADPLGSDADNLAWWASKGLRIASLTWNNSNAFADGLNEPDPPPRGGLTTEGERLLAQMEMHGIGVDLSHAHPETFWDIITSVRGPALCTHCNARGVHNVRRNLDDEQIVAIAEKQGIIGLSYHSGHISKREHAEPEELLEHLQYIERLAGPSVPALGSDFDGLIKEVDGVENASYVPYLLKRWKKAGLPAATIEAVASANFYTYLNKLDRDYLKIPPLYWRPMGVTPADTEPDVAAVFDRLNSTSVEACGDAPHFEFTARGARLFAVAVRIQGDGSSVDPVRVDIEAASTTDKPLQGAADCPADGSRCVITFFSASALPDRDPRAKTTFHLPPGPPRACVRVLDIVPLQKAR